MGSRLMPFTNNFLKMGFKDQKETFQKSQTKVLSSIWGKMSIKFPNSWRPVQIVKIPLEKSIIYFFIL